MKKWFSVLLSVCLMCGVFSLSVLAHPNRLIDDADLLTSSQESALRARLDAVSEQYDMDVVIVTVPDIGDESVVAYADDYFDYNGYGLGQSGEDGVLLLINMAGRDWYISTCGRCISAISNSDADSIGEYMVDDLSDGSYADAFSMYIDRCEYYINGEVNGFPFEYGKKLLICLVIGLVAALIVTGIFRAQLKSVRKQSCASSYVRADSMKIVQASEIFLFRNVTRVRRQSESGGSGTHISSSGASHGGSGGKF